MEIIGVVRWGVFFGMASMLLAVEAVENSGKDDWDQVVKAEGKAAEEDFAIWKSTGKVPESFEYHAIRGDRADLVERIFSNDRLAETEIKPEGPATACEVTIRDTAPMDTTVKESGDHATVWRRITKDRFEIWTPLGGSLFDADGNPDEEAFYDALADDWTGEEPEELRLEVTATLKRRNVCPRCGYREAMTSTVKPFKYPVSGIAIRIG